MHLHAEIDFEAGLRAGGLFADAGRLTRSEFDPDDSAVQRDALLVGDLELDAVKLKTVKRKSVPHAAARATEGTRVDRDYRGGREDSRGKDRHLEHGIA